MLRALLSAIAVLMLGAMAFLVYTNYFVANKPTVSGPGATAEGTPPIVPITEKPVVPPAPIVQPPPAPRIDTVVAPPPPAPKLKRTHVVQPGDSLSSISRKFYGNPDRYDKIAVANGLRSRDRIRVGQVLVIPDGPVAPPVLETVVEDKTVEEKTENTGEDTASAPPTQDFEPQPPTLNTTRNKDTVRK
jgi:LysM repeat protein